MTEYADQQAALVATVNTVPNVGNVHPRPRIGDAYDLYTCDIGGRQVIRAWEVGLGDVAPRRIQQGSRHRYTTWLIRGYHSLDDDGALTADGPSYDRMIELAYAVATAVDADQTLGGTMLDHEPVQIGSPDALTLLVGAGGIGGGYLAWVINLTFTGYTVVAT